MTTTVKEPFPTQNASPFFVRNLDILLLLAVVAIMFFYRLGSYPLFDLDEPRYAEAAREMLENGNWITPYFNYELRFDKPVFFYWLIALAYKVFGVSEFAARFFSACTASLTVASIFLFGKHWISRQYGFWAALILSTSILFAGIARMSITDMTLTCFMTLTTLCLFMAAHHNLKWWLAAGAIAGLGILTKGPVAIVVPGAIFVLYTLLIGQFKRCLLNHWLPLAIALCLAIALPWYVLAYQQNGQIFLDALLLHNVTRYSDVVSGHKQPPYFYVLVLLVGFLPWTAYLPAAIRLIWQRAKQHAERVKQTDFPYLVPLFGTVWAVFIFAFFTAGNTKLLTYILPMFPGLALLMGETWRNQIAVTTQNQQPLGWKWFTLPAWALVVITAIGGLFFITNMDKLLPREAAGIEANQYNLIAVSALFIGNTLTAWMLSRKNAAQALLAQALTMALVLIIAMQGIIPNVSKATQGVMMDYLKQTGQRPLMLYEIQRPSLTFYGKRRVPRFVEEDQPELVQELNKNKQTYVITKSAYLTDFSRLLPTSLKVRILEKGPVYSLLFVDKAP